jgi:hypothetical protein
MNEFLIIGLLSGILIATFYCFIIQPIVDGILQCILLSLEHKKGQITLKIQQLNKEITEISMPEGGGCAHQIGFVVDTDEYEDYDEGEEDKK